MSGQLKQLHFWEYIFFVGGGERSWVFGRVCTRWVCLQVIAEKKKIYYYIHVGKNPYPPDVSQGLVQFQLLVQ
jgi:hypothetical protein